MLLNIYYKKNKKHEHKNITTNTVLLLLPSPYTIIFSIFFNILYYYTHY